MSQATIQRGSRFSAGERAAYRQEKRGEQREQVERAVRELLTSDGWGRWAETRATFHRYSFGNCLLIAQQAPAATQVAGFKSWQALGRQVRKGEKAIRIMAPMSVKRENVDTGEVERVPFFRAVPVFDVAQTDGEPLPEVPREPITGDSHARYLEPLTAHAASLGFTVEREALEHAGGYCDPKRKRIVISSDLGSINAEVRVLVHELAHAHGIGYAEHGRADAEVIVETAGTIVCGSIGLDTSGEAIPYLASWGEANDLDAMRRHAATVDEIARTLEQACGLKDGGR
jgi:antirestriction protein ArdC